MKIEIHDTKDKLGAGAGSKAAESIRSAIAGKGSANIILATGASQFETLEHLIAAEGIDWSKVVMFHLDEYIDLPESHPASFRKFLRERFVDKIPARPKDVHFVDGNAPDPEAECERLNRIIADHPIDVALVGIGENGHLAFNDPPADFETEDPYIVVELDEKCRRQQMGEGWFKSVDDVPKRAISMSVKQVMKSKEIVCSVPDRRKAEAVKNCLEGEITPVHPSSILQKHDDCVVYLDRESSSLLSSETVERYR